MQTKVRTNINKNAKMSICTPNHPFTADIHIVAQILVFNIKLFPKMNSFSF